MNQSAPRLVVVGSGFAGVWAALAAARNRHETGHAARVTVVSPSATLGIRPRFYEDDLARSQVELTYLFAPVDVRHVRAAVTGIDVGASRLVTNTGPIPYDALVLAAGSTMLAPSIAGAEHVFSVDTHADAVALRRHLDALGAEPGADTMVVVGAGFTGIEVAAELIATMRAKLGPKARVVLIEKAATIAPDFGPRARAVIEEALESLGIETRTSAGVESVGADSVTLENGERIAARTVVWATGLRASPLGATLGVPVDSLGRLAVDATLRVRELDNVWAAGDTARAQVDATHTAVMSCQHAMPQGRFAGHNAMGWLLGQAPKEYAQRLYLTCLDLGAWGALMTRGFDRNDILCTGADGKAMKRFINTSAIYPPLDGDAASLRKAAKPHAEGALHAAVLGELARLRFVRSAAISGATNGPEALARARSAKSCAS